MASPRNIVRILKRLKFKSVGTDDDAEDFESKDRNTGVIVYDNGQWVIASEEMRESGTGASALLRQLKGFMRSGIKEMTGTGGVGGFATPYAFSTKEPVSSKRKKKTPSINEVFERLIEGGDPYYAWRNDETATPQKKIARVISEMNRQLAEMEKVVKRSTRLQKEMGVPNSNLWKRTNASLMKIESRMHRISQSVRNMRG